MSELKTICANHSLFFEKFENVFQAAIIFISIFFLRKVFCCFEYSKGKTFGLAIATKENKHIREGYSSD